MIAINDLTLSNNEMAAVAGGNSALGLDIGIAHTSFVGLKTKFAVETDFAVAATFATGIGVGLAG